LSDPDSSDVDSSAPSLSPCPQNGGPPFQDGIPSLEIRFHHFLNIIDSLAFFLPGELARLVLIVSVNRQTAKSAAPTMGVQADRKIEGV
jgi:hypothetical protein